MKTVKGMLDKITLRSALEQLGVQAPSRLMVHASLSALGLVEGGADTVVAALREAAGHAGAVVIPSFRDAIRSEHYALRECQDKCPQGLCPSRERGYTGAIGETVREQPDALRSCHPTHSWVGIGSDARFLLEGHCQSLTPCGTESPFFRLIQLDGQILLLGVGIKSLTNVHAVEDARNVPYLSAYDTPHRHATYTTSGKRLQYKYPQFLAAAMREIGILRSGRVGLAICHVVSARELGSFLWVVTKHDPWCLVLRPRGREYNPFEDTCSKVAGMVRAWKRNPDTQAWQLLLEASRQERQPIQFEAAENPATDCPAYRGQARGYHRCAANDLPPWEKFEDYPGEPGVATCGQCNWPK